VAEFLSGLLGPLTGLIGGALELFHSAGAPWWLSIVLLTVSVRAALLPLTVQQARSMRTMQELRPEMAEIRARYEDDRQKQQEAIMKLYWERRINPLAGLLPLLVQLPVFVTMYQVVRAHEESFPTFASGGILWFTDLTRPDPYIVLPVLSASMLVLAGEGVRQERRPAPEEDDAILAGGVHGSYRPLPRRVVRLLGDVQRGHPDPEPVYLPSRFGHNLCSRPR